MDPSSSVAAAHLSSTFLVVGGMQWLKKAKWFPLIKDGQKILNRVVSIAAAGAIQLGITYAWAPATTGAGGHTLTVVIPSASVLMVGAFHWASQYIYQETGYTTLSALQAVVDLAKLLKAAAPPAAPAKP